MDLKPCPWCQNTELDSGVNFIECKCGAMGPDPKGSWCPIDEWNTRPIEDALTKERDEALEKLEKLRVALGDVLNCGPDAWPAVCDTADEVFGKDGW